jgi:selenide,water dikinase
MSGILGRTPDGNAVPMNRFTLDSIMSTASQPATEPRLTSLSHGGGCGCKIAPGVLSDILKGMPAMPMPRELMVGIETADDAAVYRLNDEQALIATTDFFMPIVDDPYDFGRIAATNAISDVYAMGGRPIMALALVGMPINVLSVATIGRILEGGASVCRDAGIPVAGGHTIDSVEAIYGLVAMGLVHPDRVRRNADARPGDVLVLGKPLGVGVMSAALKKGALDDAGYAQMIATTTKLNTPGPDLAALPGVHALTDVTGFGLAGHALELARGAKCDVRIDWSAVPLLGGVRALAQSGFVTGASGSQLGRLRRARGAARRFRRRGQGLADRPADQRRSARIMRSGQCRRRSRHLPRSRIRAGGGGRRGAGSRRRERAAAGARVALTPRGTAGHPP